METWRKKSRT